MATLQDLLDQLRADLDEPTEAVWRDADLTVWLNAGIYRTQSVLKANRDDWQTKRLTSLDGTVTINGANYDTANLQVVANTTIYTLPPDMLEIRVLQPLNQSDRDAGLSFLPRDFGDPDFQSALRLSSAVTQARYMYEIMGLNQLVIMPTPSQTIETELYYISFAGNLALEDSITSVPPFAYSTVKAYAYYRALRSIQHTDTARAYQMFQDEKEELKSYAKPRQSQDPQFAEGVFDEYDQSWLWMGDLS